MDLPADSNHRLCLGRTLKFFQHDLFVCESLATRVGSSCMIGELLASDSFVLKLNVFLTCTQACLHQNPLQLEMQGRALVQR